MTLPAPAVDDRDFDQLLAGARTRVAEICPDWTDLSPGDPGEALLEAFAYLTDNLLYQGNRLPERAYIAFLSLIGTTLRPPAAARVELAFRLSRPADRAVVVPRGTRVTTGRSSPGAAMPTFATVEAVTIDAGATEATVAAFACDTVTAELVGTGTGRSGQTVAVSNLPIIAPTGDDWDLIVGVAELADALPPDAAAVEHDGGTYRIWREVSDFADSAAGDLVYVVDRVAGTITFAPSGLGAAPGAGRAVRVWYRHGGGPDGNVAAGTLEVLKDPLVGVSVTNRAPATGGVAAESLEHALARGPQEFRGTTRAITAGDVEGIARAASGAIARAKAVTPSALWAHAAPGVVEVLLVPHVDGDPLRIDTVIAQQTEDARTTVERALERRRPLGVASRATWARYKNVRVAAKIAVRREDSGVVGSRAVERLTAAISPIARGAFDAWPFGEALRVSHVYEILLRDPGVRYVDDVRLLVDEVPDTNVRALCRDAHQPRTWFCGAGDVLYRTTDDASGWEVVGRFPGESVECVRVIAGQPGLVGCVAHQQAGSTVRVSRDCGESWSVAARTAFRVEDLAWVERDSSVVAVLATDAGLYELGLAETAVPVQVVVDPARPTHPCHAVVSGRTMRGETNVAVALADSGGVHLSVEGGAPDTFRPIGLEGTDVRVLAIADAGPRSFVWAGTFAAGRDDDGAGCIARELLAGGDDPPGGWRNVDAGWNGGSCRSLAVGGDQVYAGSHRAGVLRVDLLRSDSAWQPLAVRAGLPLRDPGRFAPVHAVAASADGALVLAGGDDGVYRSDNGGDSYEPASIREFRDTVTLPPTWLFCSGAHEIQVFEDAPRGS